MLIRLYSGIEFLSNTKTISVIKIALMTKKKAILEKERDRMKRAHHKKIYKKNRKCIVRFAHRG